MATLQIDGIQYKTTTELVDIIGVTYVTLCNWIKQNKIQAPDRFHRNRRWRLWTQEEIELVRKFANGIHSRNGN